MDHSGDVLQTLRWGLRKYAWVIVLLAVAAGAVLPILRAQSETFYEATATVQANTLTLSNSDALPKTGEGIFNNGAVADQTRRVLDGDASTVVIPRFVELVAEQDSTLFQVVGRNADPDTAEKTANDAAAVFAREMSTSASAVGTFYVQHSAELSPTPVSRFGGGLTLLIAPLAGAVAGVGLIMLLLIWRQPVLGAASAEEITGTRVLGQITLPHDRRQLDRGTVAGLAGLARRLLSGGYSHMLLASPPRTDATRAQLLVGLERVLAGTREVRVLRGQGAAVSFDRHTGDEQRRRPGDTEAHTSRSPLFLIDEPTVQDRALRPESAIMTLVVPEGIGAGALRRAAEEYLDGDPMGVVLVRREGRGRRPRSSRASDGGEEAAPLDQLLTAPDGEQSGSTAADRKERVGDPQWTRASRVRRRTT